MDVDGEKTAPPQPDELAERLGAVRIEGVTVPPPPDAADAASPLAPGFTLIDERVPASMTIEVETEEDCEAALALRYGNSEIRAIQTSDPAWLEYSPTPEQQTSFLRLNGFLEERFLHASRCPKFTFVPFRARWAKRVQPDDALVCRAVIGLSPQGYAAAFATRGDSPTAAAYLFWRCVRSPDSRDEPWQQHYRMAEEPPFHDIDSIISSVDRSTVALWIGDSTLVVVDLLSRTAPPIHLHLHDLGSPVTDLRANGERAVLVLENGEAVVVDYLHPGEEKIRYHLTFRMHLADIPTEPEAPPPSPTVYNPVSGEPLEAAAPPPPLVPTTTTTTDEVVTHRVVAVEFDELNARAVVFSMADGGWLAHGELPPPGTPIEEALAFLSTSLRYSVMGIAPDLCDREFRAPPRERALGLLRRSVPGGEVSLAQCGHHVTWRADAALATYFERTGMAPRFPTNQSPDCGPMFSVAALGNVLVAQHQSGRVVISSLVPNPQEPDAWHARFNIRATDGATPVLLRAVPFRSLFISTTRIWALHANGELVVSRPTTKEEHDKLVRSHTANNTPPVTDTPAEKKK
jgi:hypothetical protein